MKNFTLASIFSLGLFTFSCSNDKVKRNTTFYFVTYDDVKDWDPATAFSLEVVPMSNIYEPLLWYKDSKIIPGLAKSYTKSKDGLRWIFNLQENVFFHDGSLFDAQTVKFVINRNKTFTKGPSYIWSNVETIEVLNKYTVQINLNKPVPLDLILSSQYGAWMYSTKFNEILIDSLRKGFASGTGPYYLKDWTQSTSITLERFDNYWNSNPEKGYFDKINIEVVSEASTRIQMIKNNLADFATLIPSQLVKNSSKYSNFQVSFQPSWVNHFYLLNTKKPPTDNLYVRKAIASAFDREVLNKYIYGELGSLPKGIIPSSLPHFSAPDSLIPFDLEKAKLYKKRSLLKEGNLEIDLSYVSSSEEYRLTSLMLLDNLKKVGIPLKIKPGLWTSNWDRAKNINTAPNIISMAWWPTYPTPSDWFISLFKTQTPTIFNLSYYSNSSVDSLINVAQKNESTNPRKSKDIYKIIQQKLIDDCAVIPAMDLNIQSVYNSEIIGFEPNPAYSTLFFYNLKREK